MLGSERSQDMLDLIAHAKAAGVDSVIMNAKQIKDKYGLIYSEDYIGVEESDAGILKADTCVQTFQVRFVCENAIF